MSGGIAYVLDRDGAFEGRCNPELVGLEPLDGDDAALVAGLVREHLERTGSTVARDLLERWEESVEAFVKVMPHDYKRALADLAAREPADHPVSTGGDGFVTTETESEAPSQVVA
jgi:glutamate synthase domain-containing protein 3